MPDPSADPASNPEDLMAMAIDCIAGFERPRALAKTLIDLLQANGFQIIRAADDTTAPSLQ